MNSARPPWADKAIFITGTDTGVGKTLLTAMLLHHLRQSGVHALAMKPFCSGDRTDVELLRRLQDGELQPDEINPFFFRDPVAPLVAARNEQRRVTHSQVIAAVGLIADRCDQLLIEGAGGVLVPLGETFSVLDLIARSKCRVLIVSRNRLGMINHTLLTVAALQSRGIRQLKVVVVQPKDPDISSRSNILIMNELLGHVPILALPDMTLGTTRIRVVKENQKKTKKTLAHILE